MAHHDPWAQACENFKDDLSDEEKRIFSAASPENLLEGTLLSYQRHEANSKSLKLIKTLEPFISIVRDYGAALDVLANTYSLVLSPLWGSVRVLLRIAEEAGKFLDKVVEMFARIADVLPRLQVYERLFSSHDRLLGMIFHAYSDILHFCVDAKNTFRKKGAVFKHLYWRPFQLRFQVSLVNMRNRLKNIEKEALLSHMIEASEERSLAKRDESLRKEMIKAEKKVQFLNSLSSVAYEKIHRRASKLRHPGSCGWLLQTDLYREWVESIGSAVLSVVGNPGCGKTLLASSLVDEFANEGAPEKPILYYYCDYSDPTSLDYQSIIGTLLKQLLLYMGTFPPAIETRIEQLPLFNVQHPSVNDLQSLLVTALHRFDEVIIILDAIDECNSESQRDIVELVKIVHSTKDCLVRCMVLSREEAKLATGFGKYPSFKISSDTVSRDITTFVQDSVSERVKNGDLVLKSPELEDLISSTLIEGADGMFLWVRLQLDELCEAASNKEIRDILQDLPKGLTEIYGRILIKIQANPGKIAMAKKIFYWVACAKRSLNLSELVEAIAFNAEDTSWNADNIPDGTRALQTCKNLVVLDEETQEVRFVHHTVKQLLFSQDLQKDRKLTTTVFHSTTHRGNMVLARTLCTYLCFSDFETQLTQFDPHIRPRAPDLIRTQETLMAMPHEMPLGTLLLSVWKVFRGIRTTSSKTSMPFPLLTVPKQEPIPAGLEKYRLLDYAIQHWLSHVESRSGRLVWSTIGDEKFRNNFENLVFDKHLPFSFRPWGNLGNSREFPHMSMFRWAIKAAHVTLLSLLGRRSINKGMTAYGNGKISHWILQRYCIEEMENGRSPLLWAIKNNLLDVFTALDDVNIRSFHPDLPRQLLCTAVSHSFHEVLAWVFEKTKGHVDANDLLAALVVAVERQHDANSRTIARLTAAEVQTLILTTKPFEANAKPRRYLGISTVSFCKVLDWALNDSPSNSLAAVLTTHVLVPSLKSDESIINKPYALVWAVENDKVEFMRHFMSALPFETVVSADFWEAAESIAMANDQDDEVVKIILSYLQPIDSAKYFNRSSRNSVLKDKGGPFLATPSGAGSTAKGSLLHWLNDEAPSHRSDEDDEQRRRSRGPDHVAKAQLEANANRNHLEGEVRYMPDF